MSAVMLFWTSLAMASLQPAPATDPQYFALPGLVGGGVTVKMETMLQRRFHTVIRQQYDFSCGSAALATLLRFHYRVPASENNVFSGMWEEGDRRQIQLRGFSLLDMKRYLGSLGLNADGYRVGLDQIATTAIPGIALIVTEGYRHFIVIKGVTANEVLVGDPSRGLLAMSRKDFDRKWDGLYFVITTGPDVGKNGFNRTSQWERVNRAPIGSGFGRPVEIEALRLALPDFGEL